jgi:protein-disulfide isomerase
LQPRRSSAINFKGIPEQGAVLGSQSAKVTLIEFADSQCPICKAYTFDVLPTVVGEYVRPGKVKTEYRGYPFIGPDSLKAERFLLAAAEQNKLWPLMDAFYRNQGSENSGWLTDALIRQLASEIPGLDADKLFQRAQSDELGRAAQQAAVDAQNIGISGTPTLFIKIGNGTPYQIQVSTPDQMRQALDDALTS